MRLRSRAGPGRHPFLHTGRSVEVQRRTTRFLEEHGYRVAPVTVDNGDWICGGAYAEAWNRGGEPEVPGWVRELGEGGYTGSASSSTTSL
ncbi:MAG TPA: hypothetical protein VM599_07415 [Thermoanaerobaculia bacterium]|nr:hypothetical protein [Thermoanaerobaculia bacterium]